MSKWSENYKYKNPDITDKANNVSRIMGIDSDQNHNYYKIIILIY